MKKIFLVAFLALCSFAYAQQTPVTKANYDLAERFSAKKVGNMVFSTEVRANWFKNSDKFWYSYKTTNGTKYYIVDPVTASNGSFVIADISAASLPISQISRLVAVTGSTM